MIPSEVPQYPFQMVGSDLLHWNGQDFVVVVDYYSRYWDVEKLYKTDADTVIKKIKHIFSRMGIPEIFRSDNGPQYSSMKFKKFSEEWGFQHVTSSPVYPKSNGLAEKSVQTVKSLMEKARQDNRDPYLAMLEFRNTPVDNYKSPAELACGRQLRSIIPVNKSCLKVKETDNDDFKGRRVKEKEKQSQYYNIHTKVLKELQAKENCRMYKDGKWNPANIVRKCQEPRSYIVETEDGKTYRRNRCDIMKIEDHTIEISDDESTDDNADCEILNQNEADQNNEENGYEQTIMGGDVFKSNDILNDRMEDKEIQTRSGRMIRKPERFKDYDTL